MHNVEIDIDLIRTHAVARAAEGRPSGQKALYPQMIDHTHRTAASVFHIDEDLFFLTLLKW
jgi:hypothetical protein